MARRVRIQFPGAIYHVTFRGVERRDIFRDDRDRFRFRDSLADRTEAFGIRLYLYCLMSNHVHLLLETPCGNLSAFMGSLLTSYSTYFNLRHGRSGHLTQGRYSSPLVEGDRYLLKLSRYIHLNPVCIAAWEREPPAARRVELRRYRWSSYRAYIGRTGREEFVAYEPVLAMLEGQGDPVRAYRRFVEEGLETADEELMAARERSSLAVGSEDFAARMEEEHGRQGQRRIRREDLAFRRMASGITMDAALRAVAAHYELRTEELTRHRKGVAWRPVLAAVLTRHAGLTQREAAKAMGITTGAAVCLQLQRLRGCEGEGLRRELHQIERNLNI